MRTMRAVELPEVTKTPVELAVKVRFAPPAKTSEAASVTSDEYTAVPSMTWL